MHILLLFDHMDHFVYISPPDSFSWKYLWSEVKVKVLVAQPCPTLCDPMDSILPGFSVHRILQARILEWVAISFSNAWKWKWSHSVSVRLFVTPRTTAYQAPPSMGFSKQEYWSGLPLLQTQKINELLSTESNKRKILNQEKFLCSWMGCFSSVNIWILLSL